jgi:tetratricopeptide (TPR) repeat protein
MITDSSESKPSESAPDVARDPVVALLKQSTDLLRTAPHESLALAEQARQLIGDDVDHRWYCPMMNSVGLSMTHAGKIQEAVEVYRAGLEIARKRDIKADEIRLTANLGNALRTLGNLEEALENHLRSLALLEEEGDPAKIALCLNNIANVYITTGEWDDAIRYYQRAFDMSPVPPDHLFRASIYNNLYKIYASRGDNETALRSLESALEISRKHDDQLQTLIVLHNLGNLLAKMERFEEAIERMRESLQRGEAIGETQAIALGYIDLGRILSMVGNNGEAFDFLLRGEALALELGQKEALLIAYKVMSNIRSDQGEFESALHYFQLYDNVREEMDVIARQGRVDRIHLHRTEEEKERYRRQYDDLAKTHEALKTAQNALVELERKNSVTATMVTLSHEISQPLMVISGNLEVLRLMLDTTDIPADSDRCFNRITSATLRISDILQQLRNLHRIEFTQYSEKIDMIDLKGLKK